MKRKWEGMRRKIKVFRKNMGGGGGGNGITGDKIFSDTLGEGRGESWGRST